MEAGREQGAENGLGAAWTKSKSAKSATGAPVTASGCKPRHGVPGRSIEAASRKGAVKQGGTTEAFCAPVLAGHDGPQGRERFCIRSSAAGGAAGTVPPGKNKTLYC